MHTLDWFFFLEQLEQTARQEAALNLVIPTTLRLGVYAKRSNAFRNLSFSKEHSTIASLDFWEMTTTQLANWLQMFLGIDTVNQLIEVCGQALYVGAGPRYWAESAAGDPEGWGANLQVIFVFPRE